MVSTEVAEKVFRALTTPGQTPLSEGPADEETRIFFANIANAKSLTGLINNHARSILLNFPKRANFMSQSPPREDPLARPHSETPYVDFMIDDAPVGYKLIEEVDRIPEGLSRTKFRHPTISRQVWQRTGDQERLVYLLQENEISDWNGSVIPSSQSVPRAIDNSFVDKVKTAGKLVLLIDEALVEQRHYSIPGWTYLGCRVRNFEELIDSF